jgi:hypothetical protein
VRELHERRSLPSIGERSDAFFERLCLPKCTGIARSSGCKKLDAPSAQKKIRAGNYLGGTANAVVGKHPGSIKKR